MGSNTGDQGTFGHRTRWGKREHSSYKNKGLIFNMGQWEGKEGMGVPSGVLVRKPCHGIGIEAKGGMETLETKDGSPRTEAMNKFWISLGTGRGERRVTRMRRRSRTLR